MVVPTVQMKSTWNQPRCLSAGEYTQCYTATQKEEMLSFPAKWIEPEDTVLRGKNQMQKGKGFMLALIYGSQIGSASYRICIAKGWAGMMVQV